MPPKLDPEIFLATERAYIEAVAQGYPDRSDKTAPGQGKETAIGYLVRSLDMTRDTIRNHLKKAELYHARMGHSGFSPVLPGFEITKTSEGTTLEDGTKIWVTQKPERGEVFEMPAGHKLKGVSALVDGEDRVHFKWIKTKENENGVDFEQVIKDAFESYGEHRTPIAAPDNLDQDKLSVLTLADVHLGAFSWAQETGEDYSLKIAKDLLHDKAYNLIRRGDNSANFLLLDTGDYFHANDDRAVTPQSGHHLDVDSRHSKVAEVGVDLTAFLIEEALLKHETVEYVKLPGNHDPEMSLMLSIAMAQRFRNEPRVKVRKSRERNYVKQFGKVMIAAAHGDMLKMQAMSEWAAERHAKIWGDTIFRYGYTGHVHKKIAEEKGGMIVESFAAFTAKDAWNAGMGHTGGRRLTLITLHKEEGETDRLTAPIKSKRKNPD